MKSDRIALYAGSFDPPTNGHTWVIDQIAKQYDKGYIAIGVNPVKADRFDLQQRLLMLQNITKQYSNIVVTSFIGQYQVDFAETIGANYLIRGIRNGSDFSYESDIRYINATINPDIETVTFIPPKDLLQISSTAVMGLLGYEGWEIEVAKMVSPNVMSVLQLYQKSKDKEYLEIQWNAMCSQNGLAIPFDMIWNKYSELHRFYHNYTHIKNCLGDYLLVYENIVDRALVELSIWLHDIIYDPIQSNNEDKSAKFITHDKIPNSSINFKKLRSLIMATKHDNILLDTDASYLVDIDIANFGKSARLFDYYNDQIRKEYSFVSDTDYAKGRIAVLKTFLPPNREFIFRTEFFRDRYEEKAHSNLNRIIAKLSGLIS
jgi:pantetheine-phosphate adenylyltransferase